MFPQTQNPGSALVTRKEIVDVGTPSSLKSAMLGAIVFVTSPRKTRWCALVSCQDLVNKYTLDEIIDS
jgi:hypothetical protein